MKQRTDSIMGRTAGLALVGVLAALLTPAGSAGASPPPTSPLQASPPPASAVGSEPEVVTLPEHLADTTGLSLLGASTAGIAVRQTARSGLLAGKPGTRLRPVGSTGFNVTALGTVGRITGWTAAIGPRSTSPRRLHRLNLATGVDNVNETVDVPVATTAEGWIGFDAGTLVAHTMAGGHRTLLTDIADTPTVVADADAALVAYSTFDPPAYTTTYRLALIDLHTGGVEQLYASANLAFQPALSATTLAWSTFRELDVYHFERATFQRARAGGPVRRYVEPEVEQRYSSSVIVGNRVAWLAAETGTGGSDAAPRFLRVWNGTSAIRVDFPGAPEGLAAAGSRLLTAVGGKLGRAGVYAVGPSGSVGRIATVPAERSQYQSAKMSAGRIELMDTSLTDRPGAPIWQRRVTGSARPQLSPETLLPVRGRASEGISISAGRSFNHHPAGAGGWQFLDRGKVEHTVAWSENDEPVRTQISGPYVRIYDGIFDATGKHLVSTPNFGFFDYRGGTLFGSRFIYANADADDPGIGVFDVARKPGPDNPRQVSDCQDCAEWGSEPTIWGETMAWRNSAGTLSIRTPGSAVARTLDVGTQAFGLQLSEGTLTWTDFTTYAEPQLYALDLTRASSTPVRLGVLSLLAVDGHWLLAQDETTGVVSVRRLPFGSAQPGRLIGTLAPASFQPSVGTGWTPEFDISKPMTAVALRIRDRAGRLVRTIPGTAADGSIRDVTWDGRTAAGTPAPAGRYTWTLSARTVDGEGGLVDVDGGSTVAGTVTVTART
jgi:flagellar hook capping protein FlgD